MEKTTRKLNDLLSQFLSLRNEVSEIADKTADAVFDSVELVKDGDVDSTDMEEFFESDVFLTPQENGGQPTHEIYLAKDDTLLYSNGDK